MKSCKPDSVIVFTDGSTYPKNPGYAGWAAIIHDNHWMRLITNGEKDRSNNFAETMAVVEALKSLIRPAKVTLYTDSQYVIYGMRKAERGKIFKTNQEAWEEMIPLVQMHNVTAHHVKGHSGDPLNCLADEMAQEAAKYKEFKDGYIPFNAEVFGKITVSKSERRKVATALCAERVQG